MVMSITTPVITIRDLVKNYKDSDDQGVVAYHGTLNVRPAYQRAFVYEPNDRDRVMMSVYNGLPLNSMYWAINPDGTYEVIDGQQRIISICQFITNDDGHGNPIAINFNGKNNQSFSGLSAEKQEEILDYRLQVYLCNGTDDEKLEWFHTINIAGKQMTEQELLNANYTGPWLTDAKQYFSKKTNNKALSIAFCNNDDRCMLINKDGIAANRQELLEMVLRWRVSKSDTYPEIKDYMAQHRFDDNALELWDYYQSVIEWVKYLFTTYRKEMKNIDWGTLYNKYHKNTYNPIELEKELKRLFDLYDVDPDGLKKNGFYEYVLSGDRTLIWHRVFSDKQQRQAYANQGKKCGGRCGRELPFNELEAHHKVAFVNGGETTVDNCLMLCHDCHADITAQQNSSK